MFKRILDKGTPLPKPVEYVDIDSAFFEWVDKKLDISYNGKRLPTYKLFSNQRLSEYSQTWSNLDETNSLVLNFKTITRDNNPQRGDNQGSPYNVPIDRDYPLFYVPVLQENGEEAYDLYTMKQPMSVNFMYTVSIVCNKYELLNEFNQMIHREFNALECYIFPNEHAMPMLLENITDSSEYSIDDRKYYSQSFQIKLMAYIIRKEDFKVKKIPSRFIMRIMDVDDARYSKRVVKSESWLDDINNKIEGEKIPSTAGISAEDELPKVKLDYLPMDECEKGIIPTDIEPPLRPVLSIEDDICENPCAPDEESPYRNKQVKYIIDFPYCEERTIVFIIDKEQLILDSIETDNVYDFVIRKNGSVIDFENDVDVEFVSGDEIRVDITRKDEYGDSKLTIICIDPNEVYDITYNPESALDDIHGIEEVGVKR